MITNQSLWSALNDKALTNKIFDCVGTGGPLSGPMAGTVMTGGTTSSLAGTGAGVCGYGSTYLNQSNGVVYWNEGTVASPYWTPVNFGHPELIGCYSDFRDAVGKAVADTAALYTIPGSGIRVHGNDVTQTDSGFTVATANGGVGAVGALVASATSGKLAALTSFGTTAAVPFSPAVHAPMVIDATITNLSAITSRRMFIGFLGTSADALANAVTGAGTTLTLVQDNLAGMYFDTGLTDTTGLYAPYNNNDGAASIATTATGVDTGTDIAAAGTYQRLRVEISYYGVMSCFVDKVLVTQIASAALTSTNFAGTLYIASLASATKTLNVTKFGCWAQRVTG